jgi:glycosyltransferase involved in cell wall biosynthesis
MRYLGAHLRAQGHVTTNHRKADRDLHFICLMDDGRNLVDSLCRGVPMVLRLNGVASAPNLSRHWRVYVRPVLELQRMVQVTVYQSAFCASAWASVSGGAMKGRSAVIYNGADPSRFRPAAGGRPDGRPPTILLHEHFRRDDGGLRTALSAFALVRGQLKDARLVLAGHLSGPMPGVVERFLSTAQPEVRGSIEVTGQTDHSVLPDLIRSADVFVHPVANSSCPHTVLEVLACGVPVICYSGSGSAEFVGESGIVLLSEYEGVRHRFERFPREDPAQLAAAILEVLGQKDEYRARARARAHLFSSEITGASYLRVFEETLERPPERMPLAKALGAVGRFYYARTLAGLAARYERRVRR